MSKLWVDYTNHDGKRAWREIQPHTPANGTTKIVIDSYPPIEAGDYERSTQPVINVWMVDRQAQRMLALKSIHGFAYQPDMPASVDDSHVERMAAIETQIADLRNSAVRPGEIYDAARLDDVLTAWSKSNGVSCDHLRLLIRGALAKIRWVDATGEKEPVIRPVEESPLALNFSTLREANIDRQKEWDQGAWDQENGGLLRQLFFSNELGGEVGEAQNKVKKLVRQSLNIAGTTTSVEELADELGDVAIALDLLAIAFDIDLAEATMRVFNRKSDELKMKTRLAP